MRQIKLTTKKRRALFLKTLLAVFIFTTGVLSLAPPTLVTAAGGPMVALVTPEQREAAQAKEAQNQAARDERCKAIDDLKKSGKSQKEILSGVNNTSETACLFKLDGSKPDDRRIDVAWAGDKYSWPKDAQKSYKGLDGNPYLVWSDEAGDPLEIGGKRVRFVLAQVNRGTLSTLGELQLEGEEVTWIFRNEYNRSLAVTYTVKPGIRNDFERLVFASEAMCTKILSDGPLYAAKATFREDNKPELTGRPSSEEFDKQVKDYNLKGRSCDDKGGTGLFAKAIKSALGVMKEGLEFLLATLIGWAQEVVDVGALANNEGLVTAWKTIRDLVNVFFIVILIAVAFSNILRVDTEKYGVRTLLPRLIFAVIAVNFSFMLVQVLVNFAYVLTQPFAQAATDVISNPPADGGLLDPEAGIGPFLVGFLVLIAVVVALAILTFFFIVRIIMIWLLAALSPFVFLFMVLPLTRSISSMWWKNSLKWIFMAPISFIILYIASTILSKPVGDNADLGSLNFLLRVGFFTGALVAAVMIPLKLGGEVMGRAAGAAKLGAKGSFGASKLGAKMGIGAVSAGTANPFAAKRAGEAYLEQRRKNQEQEATMGAIQTQSRVGSRLGGSRLGRALAGTATGASAGQRSAAFDAAVGQKRKEMNSHDTASKMRMLNGRMEGTQVGDDVIVDGHNLGALTQEEHDLGHDEVAAAAAFQELAEGGHATADMVTGTQHARGLAHTGYQGRSSDPDIAAFDRAGNFREGVRDAIAGNMDPDSVKSVSSDYHRRVGADAAAGNYNSDSFQSFVNMDGRLLADARSNNHRNKISDSSKRRAIFDNATAAVAAHNAGHVDLTDGGQHPERLRNMQLAAGIDPTTGNVTDPFAT